MEVPGLLFKWNLWLDYSEQRIIAGPTFIWQQYAQSRSSLQMKIEHGQREPISTCLTLKNKC